jgi:hypothetical protein
MSERIKSLSQARRHALMNDEEPPTRAEFEARTMSDELTAEEMQRAKIEAERYSSGKQIALFNLDFCMASIPKLVAAIEQLQRERVNLKYRIEVRDARIKELEANVPTEFLKQWAAACKIDR